ncbi:NADPH dehydrogenase, partial [Priestia megaterium]
GYGINESIKFAKDYQAAGVDMFDVSSGGEGPIGAGGRPGTHAGYQVPLARDIKKALDVPVIAVGRLDDSILANAV